MHTIMLIGEPGSGKTRVMRDVLKQLGQPAREVFVNETPDGRRLNNARATPYPQTKTLVLGVYDGNTYDGTDRLGRNVQPCAITLLQRFALHLASQSWHVLIEGDRLTTPTFLQEVTALGSLLLIHLQVAPTLLAARRHYRATVEDGAWVAQAGKLVAGKPRRAERVLGQSETWLKTRQTKIDNILRNYPHISAINDYPEDGQRIASHILNVLGVDVAPA